MRPTCIGSLTVRQDFIYEYGKNEIKTFVFIFISLSIYCYLNDFPGINRVSFSTVAGE